MHQDQLTGRRQERGKNQVPCVVRRPPEFFDEQRVRAGFSRDRNGEKDAGLTGQAEPLDAERLGARADNGPIALSDGDDG
jgi:hypothetical protein